MLAYMPTYIDHRCAVNNFWTKTDKRQVLMTNLAYYMCSTTLLLEWRLKNKYLGSIQPESWYFHTPYWLPFRLMITRATVVLKMCMQIGWTLMEMMESGIDASHWIVNTKSPLLWDNVNLIQRHLLFLNINLSSRYVSIASFFNCHDNFQWSLTFDLIVANLTCPAFQWHLVTN